MLKVDDALIAEMRAETPFDRTSLVSVLVPQESPPRSWHEDKITRFLTHLETQLRTQA